MTGRIRVRIWKSLNLFVAFLTGLLFAYILFDVDLRYDELSYNQKDTQTADHWQLHRMSLEQKKSPSKTRTNRPRFMATELGIRERLLVLLLVHSLPSVGATIWTQLSTRLAVRPLIRLPIPDDFPSHSQPIVIQSVGPTALLNAIANLSLHNAADWFFLLDDTTYLNSFQLDRLLDDLQWNSPVAFGRTHLEDGRCLLQAGILLSAPAMQNLIQGRHLCNGLMPSLHSENSALEICMRLAANLSCGPSSSVSYMMHWWHVVSEQQQEIPYQAFSASVFSTTFSSAPIHEQITRFASSSGFNNFNKSLTISPLLSERDVLALDEHFVRVELARIERDIFELEAKLNAKFSEEESGWPVGLTMPGKVPNRFQVSIWELIMSDRKRFGNSLEWNYMNIDENEWTQWEEVIAEANKQITETTCPTNGIFRQAYRRFVPGRGIDFLVDFECNGELDRVQLVRPIESTKLLKKVPYVKLNGDGMMILIAIRSATHVRPLRFLLRRIMTVCGERQQQQQQMRILVAVRDVQAAMIRLIGADLVELKRRCGLPADSSALLLLKPDPINQKPIQMAALDEAIDRFGPHMLYTILPPFADFQPDFLDRVRINTIRQFQAFCPIPFAEFNPLVDGTAFADVADIFVVHKDKGRFDPDDWTVASLYGTDFVSIRSRRPMASKLVELFVGQSQLHILRSIEPTLRIRAHHRFCPENMGPLRRAECEQRRRLSLGTRAQLVKLLLMVPNVAESKKQQQPL